MENIQSAQYMTDLDGEIIVIKVTFTNSDLVINVPLDPANRHYAEIMRQVEAGELTIQEASD